MKVIPDRPYTWGPPRGARAPDGAWGQTLQRQTYYGQFFNGVQQAATYSYCVLIWILQAGRRENELTVQGLADKAGLSLSTTSAALTGSAWPRWPSLEKLADAVGYRLEIVDSHRADIIPALLEEVGFIREDDVKATGKARTLRQIAAECGMRPNTLYDLAKPDRAPSSSTVLGLSAWCETPVMLRSQARN